MWCGSIAVSTFHYHETQSTRRIVNDWKARDRFHSRSVIFSYSHHCLRRDGRSPRQEYEESDVPGWRRLCEGNENPAVVLAREFSISDSANPFYLKLRNSILLRYPSTVRFEARRNSPSRLFCPTGYSLPSICLLRSSQRPKRERERNRWTFLYFSAGSRNGCCAAANSDFPPPWY